MPVLAENIWSKSGLGFAEIPTFLPSKTNYAAVIYGRSF